MDLMEVPMAPEVILVLVAVFLSLVVPVLGLYLLWRINATVTNMEKTLANLVRDRQSNK